MQLFSLPVNIVLFIASVIRASEERLRLLLKYIQTFCNLHSMRKMHMTSEVSRRLFWNVQYLKIFYILDKVILDNFPFQFDMNIARSFSRPW